LKQSNNIFSPLDLDVLVSRRPTKTYQEAYMPCDAVTNNAEARQLNEKPFFEERR
jgi:hypothetical protein